MESKTIRIHVTGYPLRRWFPSGEMTIREGTTVQQLIDGSPLGQGQRKSLLAIVNRSVGRPDYVLQNGDELMLATPFAGGALPYSPSEPLH